MVFRRSCVRVYCDGSMAHEVGVYFEKRSSPRNHFVTLSGESNSSNVIVVVISIQVLLLLLLLDNISWICCIR